MNNRVDYLSDRLVNLRGKHKSVNEVIPPDSIANGVSVRPPEKTEKSPASTSGNTALERRREQTIQLYSDFEQRLIRRNRQIALKLDELESTRGRIEFLQKNIISFQQQLNALQVGIDDQFTPSQLGERYRALDKLRLEFFEAEAELEMLLNSQGIPAASLQAEAPAAEDFKTLLKKGAALALTVGLTIAAAVLIGALILFAAWS
jgi:hypothetical protein